MLPEQGASVQGRDPATLPVLDALPGALTDWALFLDFDGTLVDIAARPEAVVVPPDLRDALTALSRKLGGALAVVTGRKLADVDALLALPEVPVAAMHGAALRIDGVLQPTPEAAAIPSALSEALDGFVAGHPGLLLEPKGESLAVHYRAVPELGPLVQETVAAFVDRHAPSHDLQPGKMVVEIKPRGVNKGRAIERLLGSAPFAGRRPAVFGDDLTDEAGFYTALAQGGLPVIVGTPDRTTAATYRLDSPAAMRALLASLAG
jgi:trehalose 6-phosphate phosphatase